MRETNIRAGSQSVTRWVIQSLVRAEALGIQPAGRELNEFQPKPAVCMQRGRRLAKFQFG